MKIQQTVEVDVPLEQVWRFVNDVPRVAPCMPGAELTRVVDDRTYEGTVTVKLGPIAMTYKGTVVVEEINEAEHSARLLASGRDVRGAGTARATVTSRLEAVSETRTRMSVESDVQLTGRVASMGRGAIQDVSAKLFRQFAECLRATLEAEGAGGAAGTEGAGTEQARASSAAGGPQAVPAQPAAPAPAAQPLRARDLALAGLRGLFRQIGETAGALPRRLRRRGA